MRWVKRCLNSRRIRIRCKHCEAIYLSARSVRVRCWESACISFSSAVCAFFYFLTLLFLHFGVSFSFFACVVFRLIYICVRYILFICVALCFGIATVMCARARVLLGVLLFRRRRGAPVHTRRTMCDKCEFIRNYALFFQITIFPAWNMVS